MRTLATRTAGVAARPRIRAAPGSASRSQRLSRRTALLLASDGLFKHARRDRIAAVLRADAVGDLPARLVDLARLPTGGVQDAAAVIVARLG